MSYIIKGLQSETMLEPNFDRQLKNIVRQNPKGSAAEKILLGQFLNSDQGAYARNVLGNNNHKEWIEHITSWLKKNQLKLQQKFDDIDFTDLESLAYDIYENYLAKQGQLEENLLKTYGDQWDLDEGKAEVRAELDQDIKDFLARGGEIEKLKPNRVRAKPGMGLASKHIGTSGEVARKVRSRFLLGKGRNLVGIKPEVAVEGEVVSMQARKTPLVVAGSPYDWDIYDLRTNKRVANIAGGDRHDKPLYEIRINSNGLTSRMQPTYVLKAGPNNNPPYRAYELEAPSKDEEIRSGVDKIEKSSGPGGTTKLKPDTMDVIQHMAKQTAKGLYYGMKLILVEEGLDQYQIVEKALGAKIMEVDDAMELGYTDWNKDDSSGYPIIYLGNQKKEGYSAGASGGAGLDEKINTPGGMGQSYRKHGSGPSGIKKKKTETAIPMFTPETKMVNANDPGSDGWKVYKAKPSGILEGILTEYDTNTIDAVVQSLPKGLTINNFTIPAFKEFLFQKYYAKVKADWDKLWPFFSKEYKEKHGIKEYKQNPYQIVSGDINFFDDMLLVIPKGLNVSELYKQAFKEFLYKKFADREWQKFKQNRYTYWDAYQKLSGNKQGMFGKLKSKIGLESSIMKGLTTERKIDEYDIDSIKRTISYSKENPPSLDYLYRKFIEAMISDNNTIQPKVWIDSVNKNYGLDYTYKHYQDYGHKYDHIGGWDKFVKKYILNK